MVLLGRVDPSGGERSFCADSHPWRSFQERVAVSPHVHGATVCGIWLTFLSPSAHTPMPVMGSSPGNILPNAIWSWNIENTARCFFVVMRIRLTQALFVFQGYWCSGIAHSLWAWPWLMTHDSRLQQEETCVFELCCADCNSCHAGWL